MGIRLQNLTPFMEMEYPDEPDYFLVAQRSSQWARITRYDS